MMTLDQVATATIDKLTDELAAACWDSSFAEIHEAREAAARLLYQYCGDFELCDSETNEVIRPATEDETVASVLVGPEGHILVDGRRCYVA